MKIKRFQLFFLAMYQLNSVAQCPSRLGKECPTSEDQESILTTGRGVDSELSMVEGSDETKCDRNRMAYKNNRVNERHDGVVMETINALKNTCYSEIANDLYGDLMPLTNVKCNTRPQIINEKKKNMEVSFDVPACRNLSYIKVDNSPPKLKLKQYSVLNKTGKNKSTDALGTEKTDFIEEPHSEKQKTVENKTRIEIIERVFGNYDTVKGKKSPENQNETTDGVTCSQEFFNTSEHVRRNSDLKLNKKGLIVELTANTQEVLNNSSSVLETLAVLLKDMERSLKEERVSPDAERRKDDMTCGEYACRMPKRLNKKSNLQFKKGFIHELSNKSDEKLHNNDNVGTSAVGVKDVGGSLKQEQLLSDVESKKEDATCSGYICSRQKHPRLQKHKLHDKEEEKLSDGMEKLDYNVAKEDTSHDELNMKELAENIEGMRQVLLDRQQQINKDPLADHNLLKNISSLIDKLDLLRSRIEMFNVTAIENNILTPDEEALISGFKLNLNEVDRNNGKHEKWPLGDKNRDVNDERNKYFFSSAWGQCAACITVAKQMHEAFTAVLENLKFKDIPPPYLDLGDDWCKNFSKSVGPILSEFQQNCSSLFYEEEKRKQFQGDLAKEFIEKCSLYRSLVTDVQLYRHWLRNNNDMIKTICRRREPRNLQNTISIINRTLTKHFVEIEYTIEFKSCSPFLL